MISITTKSPYALSALVELRHQGDRGPVPIAELARRRQIPVQFLEQLFATLRRSGVLRSQRGVKGGYSFARPAGEITVLELVELLDGPVGSGATGVFAEAAEAARAVLGAVDRRGHRRRRVARRRRGHVPHLERRVSRATMPALACSVRAMSSDWCSAIAGAVGGAGRHRAGGDRCRRASGLDRQRDGDHAPPRRPSTGRSTRKARRRPTTSSDGTTTVLREPDGDDRRGSGTADAKVSRSIGSLAPNTTYHYRLVATNAVGNHARLRRLLQDAPSCPSRW